jgi:hypothetical protein
VLGDQVRTRERIMPMGLPSAIETTTPDPDIEVRGGLTFKPIRAAVAFSVLMFGMLAGANIAALVMPPVDGAATYLLHLPPSPWQTR